MGAMGFNAALHLTGTVSLGIPQAAVIPAFVVLGILVGVRFRDVTLAQLGKVFSAGFAVFSVSMAISAAGALIAWQLTGLPLLAMLLAFAPGGFEVMVILAFAFGMNPAFVGTHQLIRYLALNASLSLVTASVLGDRSD